MTDKPLHPRSPHWPKVREAFLKGKRCAVCGGTEYLEAHHKKPFHLFGDLELVTDNLIPLCEKPGHDCHFVFGHFWDWKRYNPLVAKMADEFSEKSRVWSSS